MVTTPPPTLYHLAGLKSHKALADALNVDPQRMTRWLHHKQPLPAAMVIPLAKILDQPIEVILHSCQRPPVVKPRTPRAPRAYSTPPTGRPVGTTKAAMRARFQDTPP